MLYLCRRKDIYMISADKISRLDALSKYVLTKGGCMDVYHFVKILYFANKEHSAKYCSFLVPDTFVAMSYGPVPSLLYNAIKIAGKMVDANLFDMDAVKLSKAFCVHDGNLRCITASSKPDLTELSKAEMASLDRAISNYVGKTFDELKNESHDLAWQTAWEAANNSAMNSFLIAKAGGASDETIAYMREQKKLDELLEGC